MTPTPSEQDLNLLAAIPYQLGFRPVDSAVLVAVRANRLCGLMIRVDLDSIIEGRELLVNELIEHLVRDGAVGVVAAIYSDDDVAATGKGEGICALTAQAMKQLDSGFRQPDLLKMWLVGEKEFTDLDLSGPWPIVTDRYDDDWLNQAPIAAELVVSGRAVADDREALGRLPALPEDIVMAEPRGTAGLSGSESRSGVLALWREVLKRGPMTWPSPERLAAEGEMWRTLAEGLHDIDTRDAMIVSVTLPSRSDLHLGTDGVDAEVISHAMTGMLDPASPIEPDPERVQRAIVALEIVAAFTASQLRGPALTLLALFAWWTGHGALAWVRLDQVAEADDDYRLARLVESAVSMGVPPAWIAAQTALHRVGNS